MIEHRNIINALHSQIEALLDLIQCADSDCVDAKSMSTAAEMSQTMLDEVMTEVDKIEADWRQSKVIIEEVQTAMCDDFCRFTHEAKTENIEHICEHCPLNRLDG